MSKENSKHGKGTRGALVHAGQNRAIRRPWEEDETVRAMSFYITPKSDYAKVRAFLAERRFLCDALIALREKLDDLYRDHQTEFFLSAESGALHFTVSTSLPEREALSKLEQAEVFWREEISAPIEAICFEVLDAAGDGPRRRANKASREWNTV